MEHIKLKKGAHLIVFSAGKAVPVEILEKVASDLQTLAPELATMVTQSDITVLTMED
jgi:hypothetical protein